jgi:hypothetical protein
MRHGKGQTLGVPPLNLTSLWHKEAASNWQLAISRNPKTLNHKGHEGHKGEAVQPYAK